MPQGNPQALAGQLQVGTPTISYPVPDIANLFILEKVDTYGPSYKALVYGAVYTGPTKYPNFKLVWQAPLDHQFVKRIWTNDRTRASQDVYNLTRELHWDTEDFPWIWRTYVLPRTGYTERTPGTAEPGGSGTVLNNLKYTQLEDETLRSLYIAVTEFYTKIPDFNDGSTSIQQDWRAPDEFLTGTGTVTRTETHGSGQSLPELGTDGTGNLSAELKTVNADHDILVVTANDEAVQTPVESEFYNDETLQKKGTLASSLGNNLAPTAPDYLQISSRVTPLKGDKTRRDDITVEAWVPLQSSQVDPDAQGKTSTTIVTRLPIAGGVAAPVTNAFGTLALSNKAVSDVMSVKVERKITTPFPIIPTTRWDEFAGTIINITRQMVEAGTVTSGLVGNVLTEEQGFDNKHTVKIVSGYSGVLPSVQVFPVAVRVNKPAILEALNEIFATSGVDNAYGLEYTMKEQHGTFPGTLTRTWFGDLGSATAAAHDPDLIFNEESNFYPHSDAVTSFNPNFLGRATVTILREPMHTAADMTGDFYQDVQVRAGRFGSYVLEELKVTLPATP